MTWDDLLEKLRARGMKPAEEDYMENYGHVAAREREALRGRYFRCTYGVANVDGIRFETYIFASEGAAEEFVNVVGVEDGEDWHLRRNLVFHVSEAGMRRIDPALD